MPATGGREPGDIPAFPWDSALTLGLHALRWRPQDVWAATPRELALAAGAARRPEAAGRADLARLLEAFPDGA
ncbi:phage tail assembly chaperone [Methylobacterium durans]|uniref:Phage tail assembly chaperone n=1 Tax=Methylobacterium durans TaxID=2202825 RepID=A0A2U8W6Q8_9HYPH|nr:phage tail assembly chaperone [Methylobacterium durans]AWN41210.1 phage tail assembly chaperone [Methylobacterium durans]